LQQVVRQVPQLVGGAGDGGEAAPLPRLCIRTVQQAHFSIGGEGRQRTAQLVGGIQPKIPQPPQAAGPGCAAPPAARRDGGLSPGTTPPAGGQLAAQIGNRTRGLLGSVPRWHLTIFASNVQANNREWLWAELAYRFLVNETSHAEVDLAFQEDLIKEQNPSAKQVESSRLLNMHCQLNG
jgi:hypothetical protein